MIKKLTCIIGAIFCLFIFTSVFAVEVPSLYSAQIPVQTRSEAQRNQAIQQALQLVLIKASGNVDIAKVPQITAALQNANKFVRDFSYINQQQNSNQILLLNVRFVSLAVNSLLQQSNQPVWMKNRPSILVWLVTQDKSGPQLFGSSSDASVVQMVQNAAKLRGVPTVFPMLDLTDLRQVQPSDVWAPFIDVIQNASSRYSPDGILILRIDETNKANIVSRWMLLLKDQQLAGENSGSDLQAVIQTGIDQVTGALSQQFAVVENTSQQSQIMLTVTGLQGVGDYAEVMKYLRGLSGVTNVEVGDVTSDKASFQLTLSVSDQALQQAINLDAKLSPQVPTEQATQPQEKQTEQKLQYKYNKPEPAN